MRTRRLTVRLHHAYPAGRFTLVAAVGRRTVARGSLTARVTRRGAAALRRARRLRVTLTFVPAGGSAVVTAKAVTLRR
jgi:hypothetical protein